MSYKTKIDSFIKTDIKYLRECAKHCLQKTKMDPDDLVGELLIYLYSNEVKLSAHTSLQGFSVQWIRNESRWTVGKFNKKYALSKGENLDLLLYKDLDLEHKQNEIHLTDHIDYNDYYKDLLNVYPEQQVNRIVKIHSILSLLNEEEQMLYEAYFTEGMTYKDIQHNIKFRKGNFTYNNPSIVYLRITALKDKIKLLINGKNN